MKKYFWLIHIFLCVIVFASCGNDYSSTDSYVIPKASSKTESQIEENSSREEVSDDEDCYVPDDTVYEIEVDERLDEDLSVHDKRAWTFLVYMAADNNLEGDGITDFNEMEQVDYGENANLLVLFDRAENYDATNGNWTDTRLYRVSKDEQQNKTLIASERLDCEELGLKNDFMTELDMANPLTMSGFLSFARRCYPADNYALIIWGHGTGWRNSELENEPFRAVAVDSASGSYMTISQMRQAILDGMEEEKLSVIGFDTCFGVCLESAYELSDCAKFMVGTPALVPESGWNYTDVFNDFLGGKKTVSSFMEVVSEQFKKSYKNYSYAAFSCIDLEKIPMVVNQLSVYSKSLADSITSKSQRDKISSVFTEKCVSYCAVSYPSDFYVDLRDLLSFLDSTDKKKKLVRALDEAIVSSWSASGHTSSLGLFFCVYQSSGVIQASHPSMYTNGSRDPLVSRFVTDCTGYVPCIKKNGSLMEKLFYTNF